MKNVKMLVAVCAVLVSAAAAARAEEVKIDFDGKKGAGSFSAEAVKAAFIEVKLPEPGAAVAQAQADKSAEIVIKARMKNGGKITEEKLTCKPGQGGDKVADCRKSDSAALTFADVNSLSLRSYYSEETLKFADLQSQNKHSYTNQSGPMTFSCEDSCANWELVEVHFHAGLGNILDNTFERKCVEWTHECECTAGCDN